jgi:D-alanyl-D-alanine carboxypeptidase
MLRSGNDAAIALSEEVGGSEEGFVILMNNLAKSIGMNNTTFINSSGLENNEGIGNTSTAYDMALLMSYAMKNDIFQKITSTTKKIVKTNYKTYEWYNKNKLLNTYKYTTGGKTGYTKKAYRTLVTTASKDNKNLVIVTLNESNDFIKHKNLYEEYFKKYKLVNLIDHKTFLKSEGLYVKEDINMLLSDSEIDKVNVNVTYTNDAIDRIGYVTVSLDNKEYYRENIYLIENSSTNESLLSKIKKFFSNLFKF